MTRLELRVVAKTTAYTLRPQSNDRPGQAFSNRGATGSVTFTLPSAKTALTGWWYEFWVQANQSLIVAGTAGELVAPGNAAANNVSYETASKKVGGRITVYCDGTSWYAIGSRMGGGFCVNGTEIVADDQVTPGTPAASRMLILDANKATDGTFLIKLGAAITVQSPPLLGLPADVVGAASGTVQNTFYSLSSVAIPANALSANGKGFAFSFAGTTAANANAKDFQLVYGTATITLTTGNTGNGVAFVVYGVIYRTSAGNQVVVGEIVIGTASPIPIQTTSTADETAAWTFALQSRNTAAAAASATGKFGQVTFQN